MAISRSIWGRRAPPGMRSRWRARWIRRAPISRSARSPEPVCTNIGNPHATFFVPDAEAIDLAALGPRARARQAVSRARQYRRRDDPRSRPDPPARLGTRRRHHPRLRHRRLRRARRGIAPRPDRPPRRASMLDGGDPRHNLARGRPCHHDRAGRAWLRGHASTPRCSPELRPMSAGRDHHLRLPPQRFRKRGHPPRCTAEAGLRDAVIVNTCAVTAEAERQARQAIRRARREHPDARIIVTGCAATLAPERYAALARGRPRPRQHAPSCAPRAMSEIAPHRQPSPAGGGGRLRAVPRRACPHLAAEQGGMSRASAGAGLSAGAAGLRPSLHLLHHPLCARASRSVPLDEIIADRRARSSLPAIARSC